MRDHRTNPLRAARALYPRCCGLDVHKATVVACLLHMEADGRRATDIHTLGTTTDDLLALGDWLRANSATHVAMEATGSYWKPLFNLLEGQFTVWVVNAAHIKPVPGHKTDVHDAEWIADLLQHGLLQPGFIPNRFQRELRDLTRSRTTVMDDARRSSILCNRSWKTPISRSPA
jgi:transposase